jgi:hypothetical protein
MLNRQTYFSLDCALEGSLLRLSSPLLMLNSQSRKLGLRLRTEWLMLHVLKEAKLRLNMTEAEH